MHRVFALDVPVAWHMSSPGLAPSDAGTSITSLESILSDAAICPDHSQPCLLSPPVECKPPESRNLLHRIHGCLSSSGPGAANFVTSVSLSVQSKVFTVALKPLQDLKYHPNPVHLSHPICPHLFPSLSAPQHLPGRPEHTTHTHFYLLFLLLRTLFPR